VNKFEFKEGETIVITGYTPDVKKKNNVICVDYMTKHGMEVDSWKGITIFYSPIRSFSLRWFWLFKRKLWSYESFIKWWHGKFH